MQPPTIRALADKANGEAKEIFRIRVRSAPTYVADVDEAGFNGDANNPGRRLHFGEYSLTFRSQTEITEAGKTSRGFFVFVATNRLGESLQIAGGDGDLGNAQQLIVSFGDGAKLARFLRGGMTIWVYPNLPVD